MYKATVKLWKIIPEYDVYISELVKIEINGLRNKKAKNYLLDLVKGFELLPVSDATGQIESEFEVIAELSSYVVAEAIRDAVKKSN
ncbi:MAG: hypothetical protein ACPLSJ_06475 [Thermosulfidibacteraceae bacterium]